MEAHEMRRLAICERTEDGVEFSVLFDSVDDVYSAVDDLHRMRLAYSIRDDIQELRKRCTTTDGVVYYPKDDTTLPKARWVMLAAAASFPRGVPVSLVVKKLRVSSEQLSAYCTSKNNPTSRYLYMKEDSVHTKPEGIPWLVTLLTPKADARQVNKT